MEKLKSSIIDLETDASGLVSSLSLKGEDKNWGGYGSSMFDPVDHEDFADQIMEESSPVLSVLVFVSHLREELFDDPRHATKSTEIIIPSLDEEIMRHLLNRFPMMEDALELAKGLGIDVDHAIETGRRDGEGESKVVDKILDGLYQAMLKSHYPDLIADRKKEFKTHDPLTMERRKKALSKEELEKDWPQELLRILAPRTEVRYARISPLPSPLSNLTYWHQYYLTKRNGEVLWMVGSSAGSSTRYVQGRFAHTFATLENRGYSGLEGTVVIHITRENEARLLGIFKGLKTTPYDLSGNYASKRETVEALFSGKRVVFNDKSGQLEE